MTSSKKNKDDVTLNFDPAHLLKLARDKTEKGREKLTEEVSDVFREHLTTQEQVLASEIMTSLLMGSNVDLRHALSERLSLLEGVPLDLVLTFSYDDILVARPMLIHSPVLSDADLINIIEEKNSPLHWEAVSKRTHISPVVVNALIETGDEKTSLSLIENESLKFSRKSMNLLSNAALGIPNIHEPLLARSEVDREQVMRLYFCVSQTLRKTLMDGYGFSNMDLERTLNEIILELKDKEDALLVMPAMMDLAMSYGDREDITSDLLIKSLRRGQLNFFIALLAAWLNVSADVIRFVLEKENGSYLSLACRAVGMIRSEFASLFLLSRGLCSGQKIVGKTELSAALKLFDESSVTDAKKKIRYWSDMINKGKEK